MRLLTSMRAGLQLLRIDSRHVTCLAAASVPLAARPLGRYRHSRFFIILLWSDLHVVRTGAVYFEPRHRESGGVVCRPVSTLKADISNITYDCYSQNNNIEIAAL